ncbi:MAG TPA: hypothetical protein VE990_12250 [Acidimicrobiales bacterium]|nr:hypothetical protein [Acidimicrobiales bacterium]
MASSQSQADILDLLRTEDDEIVGLFEEYFSPASLDDHVKRASIGFQLLDRLAVQEEAKEEIVQRALADAGEDGLVEQLEADGLARKRLLAELDELSAGVSARDVHVSNGRRFDEIVRQLRDLTEAQLRREADEVVPSVRRVVPPDRLASMSGDLDRVRRRAPTRPRPDGPAHRTPTVVKMARAAYDRLRDFPDAAHHESRAK